MKDNWEIKIDEIEVSLTLGGSGEGRVQGRGKWRWQVLRHQCGLGMDHRYVSDGERQFLSVYETNQTEYLVVGTDVNSSGGMDLMYDNWRQADDRADENCFF